MPVLLNKDSGLAENLPDQAALGSLQSGTHEIPLVSPEGDFGSAPHEDAARLIQQGYTQPSPEQLGHLLKEAKYSTTGQQIAGGLEQVAKGALGPLATGTELALGVPKEDILGREETAGTATKMIGQGIGLVGSSFIPVIGQEKILSKAAEGIMGAFEVGKAATTVGKIGSMAAKAAIENAVYQGGDEVSKAILSDPGQTAGSALMNVGLASAIGAGFGGGVGAVSPLWSATVGPNLENGLRFLANRANGETLPISEELSTVLAHAEKNGITIPPEIKAGLSDNPMAQDFFRQLKESGTGTGDAIRQTVTEFQDHMADQLASVFKTKEPMTAFEAGEKAKDVILEKANALNDAISTKYKEIIPHLDAIQIPDKSRLQFYDTLVKTGQETGAKGGPAEGIFRTFAERALAQDTVGQLKQLITEVGSEWSKANRSGDFVSRSAFGDLRNALKEFQDRAIINSGKALEEQGVPGAAELSKGLIADKKIADKAYAQFIDTIGEVASAGKLGKVKSHGQLLEALDRVPAEKLADKLFDPKNVESLRYLQKEFPEVFDAIIQAKKTSILDMASKTGDIQHNKILNQVNGLSKEIRKMMFTPEEENIINASGRVLRESYKRQNPSGTGGTLDKMLSGLPAGVGALASAALGHGAIAGALAGYLVKFLGRDAPDAAKMAFLKFLGSSNDVSGTGWKAAAEYIEHALKGELLLQKASKAAIKAGQEVLPKSQIPDNKSREKLDKKLKALKTDQASMLEVGGHIDHYMPDHAEALAGMSMNAVNYLNSIRPEAKKLSPLDTEVEPPKSAVASFNRALDIAEQPLVICQSIQDGTLTPLDIKHLNEMYPTVRNRLMQTMTAAMIDKTHKDEPIKYAQRMSLSLFMGQALDSTMLPQNIIAAQPPPPPQDQMMPQQQKHKGSMKDINKLAQGNASGAQTREMQKAGTIKT